MLPNENPENNYIETLTKYKGYYPYQILKRFGDRLAKGETVVLENYSILAIDFPGYSAIMEAESLSDTAEELIEEFGQKIGELCEQESAMILKSAGDEFLIGIKKRELELIFIAYKMQLVFENLLNSERYIELKKRILLAKATKKIPFVHIGIMSPTTKEEAISIKTIDFLDSTGKLNRTDLLVIGESLEAKFLAKNIILKSDIVLLPSKKEIDLINTLVEIGLAVKSMTKPVQSWFKLKEKDRDYLEIKIPENFSLSDIVKKLDKAIPDREKQNEYPEHLEQKIQKLAVNMLPILMRENQILPSKKSQPSFCAFIIISGLVLNPDIENRAKIIEIIANVIVQPLLDLGWNVKETELDNKNVLRIIVTNNIYTEAQVGVKDIETIKSLIKYLSSEKLAIEINELNTHKQKLSSIEKNKIKSTKLKMIVGLAESNKDYQTYLTWNVNPTKQRSVYSGDLQITGNLLEIAARMSYSIFKEKYKKTANEKEINEISEITQNGCLVMLKETANRLNVNGKVTTIESKGNKEKHNVVICN